MNASSVSSSGRWYRFVLRTWRTSGTSGSNGSRIAGIPLIDSAPIVVPWYAMWREIAFQRRPARCGMARASSSRVGAWPDDATAARIRFSPRAV